MSFDVWDPKEARRPEGEADCRKKATTDITIASAKRRAMDYRCQAAYEHEVHIGFYKGPQ